MTTIMIGKALATVTENEILTSGMINAKIKFEFSEDWTSNISKTAIFTAGDVTKVVLDSYWENNVCSIPQECLAKSDEILMVGIYGADNANVVAIPTVWATVGKIRKGYEGYEDVSTGTLPIWAQVQSAAAQSATAAKNAQAAAEAAAEAAVDLTPYAKKTEVPTKTSQLTNDSGFLTSHQDISGKQDKLIAGEGITIASDGKTISSNCKVSSVNGQTGVVVLDADAVGAQKPLIAGSGITIIPSDNVDIIQSNISGSVGNGLVSFVNNGVSIAQFTLNQTQDCEINVNDLTAHLHNKFVDLETADKKLEASLSNNYRTAANQDKIDSTKLTDAPTDGKEYARKNGSWHEIAVVDVGVESVNGKTGVVTLNATEIPSTKFVPADTISFLIDGAFDEALVELTRNGASASANDFISAVNSGSTVTVSLHDQGNPKVTFEDMPVKYKITNDTLSLCFIAEAGHTYSRAIYVLSGPISGAVVSDLVENRFTDSFYQENYVSANDLPVQAPLSVEEYLEELESSVDALQSKSITDTGGYFTTDTVEGALQEIGAELADIVDGKADATDIPSLEGYATEAYVQNYHDNTKQDTITDLATIRSGASKGATAVQPEAGKGLFSGSYNDLTDKPAIPDAVTEGTVSGWGFTKNTGTYSKPTGGIPKADLANDVKASLGKADTALQEHQSLAAYRTAEAQNIIDNGKQDKITSTNKLAYSLISGTPTIPTVPTNLSAFTNDAGYLTLATLPKYEGVVE